MNVSRNMFFAAVAVAVVSVVSVSAIDRSTTDVLKENARKPKGVAFMVTAAGVIVDETTSYSNIGKGMRDGGLYGSAYVLASENPTLPGTVAAMGVGTATAQACEYAASTQTGQNVAAKAPEFVRNNSGWLKHCLSTVTAFFAGSKLDQMQEAARKASCSK